MSELQTTNWSEITKLVTEANLQFLRWRQFQDKVEGKVDKVVVRFPDEHPIKPVPWQGSPVPPGRGVIRPFVGAPQYILY